MDIEQIIGTKKIMEIKLSKYTLALNFESQLNIVVCDYCYLKIGDDIVSSWHYNKHPQNFGGFISLIESQVCGAFFSENKGLRIEFEKFTLEIPKPDDDFEYLHIFSEDHEIYIF